MLNYWLIIEIYFLFNSMFLESYVVLTLSAILALCLLVVVQVCRLKLWKKICKFRHGRNEYDVIGERVRENADSDVDLFRAAEDRQGGDPY